MIKLLIADNHPIIRKGLELLFSASSNIKIVGSVDDGAAILEFIKKNPGIWFYIFNPDASLALQKLVFV